MRAIAVRKYFPVTDPRCFEAIDLEIPAHGERDLVVSVQAIAINPVDIKIRESLVSKQASPIILGWDAAGIVEQVGSEVTLFKPGDEVFYAGTISRHGCYSQYHLVDERIVGKKPISLTFAESAALPLTSVTAWEALFERLEIDTNGEDHNKYLLIIGAAGGAGSIAIQLAKSIANLNVIGTASSDKSSSWIRELGADRVVNHSNSLIKEVKTLGIDGFDYVLCCHGIEKYWQEIVELLKPQGKICSIVRTREPLDMSQLFEKSGSLSWEFMFTRPEYKTKDMIAQHHILSKIANLVDSDVLRTTLNWRLTPISPANASIAHGAIEQGHVIGKIVLDRWL